MFFVCSSSSAYAYVSIAIIMSSNSSSLLVETLVKTIIIILVIVVIILRLSNVQTSNLTFQEFPSLNPAQNWTTCTQGHTWHWDCQNLSIFAESVWQHAYVKDHALQVSATLFSSAHSSWLHSHAFMNTHTHTLTCKRSTLNSSVPWIWHRTEPRALNVTRGTGIASLHKSLQCQFGSMPMRGSMRFRSLQECNHYDIKM